MYTHTSNVVPDKPTEFQVAVINSTSMRVTWGPPADPNGIILSYSLFVTLDAQDAMYLPGPSSMNVTINDVDTRSHLLTDLHEFATYSLELAAATSVGIGDRTEPIAMTTEMAGEKGYTLHVYMSGR